MRLAIVAAVALGLVACGTLFHKQDEAGNSPPAAGAKETNLVINPDIQAPLEAVRDSRLPYASEGAALVLAVLTAYAGIRNRKLKKTASVLTQNIGSLNLTPEGIKGIKEAQEKAGVRDEVRSLLNRQ